MTGTLKFQWDGARTTKRVEDAALTTMNTISGTAHEWWNIVAPVGTDKRTRGELRASWRANVRVDEIGVALIFGAYVRHAVFVELGTGKMPPRAPLRTVAAEVVPLIPYELAGNLR